MRWRTYPALAATALAALVPMTLPAPASAATSQVAVTAGRLEVAALTSGPHKIRIVRRWFSLQSYVFEVADSAGTLVPGAGCSVVTSAKVLCSAADVTSYQVETGDDADTIDVRTLALPGTIDGGAGDDTLYPGTGAEVVIGGDGRDRVSYIGRTSAVAVRIDDVANDGTRREGDNVRLDVEWVTGGSGADLLVGDADYNRLDGGPGDDQIDGGAGPDVMIGGDGLDTVTYASRTAPVRVVHGTTGNGGYRERDVLDPTIEIAIGGAGNDAISGFYIAHGGAGNDIMQGDDDADQTAQVHGGPGDDTLSDPDNDIEFHTNHYGGDRLHGGEGADHLTGVADVLDGGPGPDVMIGPSFLTYADYRARSAPVIVTLDGEANDGEAGEGDNVTTSAVLGGAGDDRITGSALDESLRGGAGADTVIGRGGKDWIEGGAGGDHIDAGEGDDKAWGDDFDPESFEGGNDRIIGGPGADHVYGQWGDDLLVNGPGADVYDGGNGQLVGSDATPGADTLTYASSTTPVTVNLNASGANGEAGEGDGIYGISIEYVIGGSGADTIVGHDGANRLRGGPGDDTLEGLGGFDVLYGLAGNDQMSGGEGNDFLYGDVGTDAANGGNGNDTCVAELLIFCEK